MALLEHNFSGALATWKDINLTELQKTLDSQGLELVENQKESVVGRKALADKTKDFKKIPDEEKVNAFKGLLKSYQTEIDSLTKRSKSAESAFLSLYKVLAEAPDPYPLLEVAVDQTVKVAEARDLEDELQRVKAENAELQRRVSELASLRSCEEKRPKPERSSWRRREQGLHRQVSLLKDQLRDLRVSNESTEARLLDQSQRLDQEVVAKLAEMDMELLRAEIESLKTGNDSVKHLELQVTSLETEVDRLSQSFGSQKAVTATVESNARKAAEEHAREAIELRYGADILCLVTCAHGTLQYVEFAGLEGDLDEEDGFTSDNQLGLQLPNPNASKANAHPASSLEALLATKNKRILEELTKFRILHTELEASLQRAQDDLASTTQELEKHRRLNERLETDLLKIEQHGNGDATPADPAEDDVLAELGLELGLATKTPSNSILPIVTSQRDRLPATERRTRRVILPATCGTQELRKQFQVISELRAEIRSLQSDNPETLREEAMNPFEAFRGREAALYAVGLHALVMFTLYECTASSSSHSRVQPVPYPQ
ncbi:hypothetical protein EDB83DRAFT_2309753 [Lactarius deliciosus]|nr:hypothetical protein EDB83DRAFT_2309753 [Lactarius deliciosus]